MKKIVSLALALCLCLASVAVLAETTHVKVGVVGENNEQWEQVIIPTLAEEGIEIELVKFSDYIIPNQALANGEVVAEKIMTVEGGSWRVVQMDLTLEAGEHTITLGDQEQTITVA